MSAPSLFWPKNTWLCADFSGRDARDFLQRMSTVDLRALKDGEGGFGFFLYPSGKIRSAFWLWRCSESQFLFELPPETPNLGIQALRETIEQFTFAEDQTLTPATDLECVWVFSENPNTLPCASLTTKTLDTEIRICAHGDLNYGLHWWSVWGRGAPLRQEIERLVPLAKLTTWEELEERRILVGSAGFGSEITPDSNPLEIGLKNVIADQKGCYPGQEVIEKIIALGEPAYRLVKVEGASPLLPGPLSQGANTVGQLTSVSGTHGLARVRKLVAQPGLELLQGAVSVRVL